MQKVMQSHVKPEIQVFANPEALTQAAATEFVRQVHQAIGARGRFTIALSGGSTPKSLYALLELNPGAIRFPGSRFISFGEMNDTYRQAIPVTTFG